MGLFILMKGSSAIDNDLWTTDSTFQACATRASRSAWVTTGSANCQRLSSILVPQCDCDMAPKFSKTGRSTEVLCCETCMCNLPSQVNFSTFRSRRDYSSGALLSDGDSPKNTRRGRPATRRKSNLGDGCVGIRVKGVHKARARLLHLRSVIPGISDSPILRQDGHCGSPQTTRLGG